MVAAVPGPGRGRTDRRRDRPRRNGGRVARERSERRIETTVAGDLDTRLVPRLLLDRQAGERDRRTRDQKQADLVGHWLTSCTGTDTDIRAEIAISIPATDLIGLTDGPGITRDGEPLANAWVRELAQSEHTVFRRLVLDPVGEVLDTSVLTYRPPESLRQALHWRDGTCRVAGCRAPVDETDLDHAIDYHDSGGETSGPNLRCLCRKHHNMKSHGHLDDRHLDTPTRHIERYRVTS